MKKTILMMAAAGLTLQAMAQDKYVTSANMALGKNNLEEAKEEIDKAMQSPETKEKPKALMVKAQIYFSMQNSDKYKATNPYKEGAAAVMKLAETKPDYEKGTIDQLLRIGMFLYYNEGAKAYNDKKLLESTESMNMVQKIYDLKHFSTLAAGDIRKLDTIAAEAKQTLATSAYYQGKYDESIPMLTAVKNNPITKTPSIYECLIDAMQRQSKPDALAVIQEGRKLFPDDVTIRNYELNYYIASGKQDEIVKKLEEAAAKEPNNADIQFNIATTYLGMASAKDGKKPANAAEMEGKSELAFQKALKISPENAVINYNFGALYFNQATGVNDQMNAITGSSDADQRKYDELKKRRDELFAKAAPYFEKAYTVFTAGEKDLREEDKRVYKNTMKALLDIYSRLSKMDKYGEVKKKSDAMN